MKSGQRVSITPVCKAILLLLLLLFSGLESSHMSSWFKRASHRESSAAAGRSAARDERDNLHIFSASWILN